MSTRIAILAWGSLIWERWPDFDTHRNDWLEDGPTLSIEFSRISSTRHGALTLVLDARNGSPCQVGYARSRRSDPEDTICDLRCREGTVWRHIGYVFVDGSRQHGRNPDFMQSIREWAQERSFDVVVWTDLPSNFEEKRGKPFSVDSAVAYVQGLKAEGKAKAAEYVWRAPPFVETPLRAALQAKPWFRMVSS